MRVAVLGMGVIGKRVADAVRAHPALELAGVGVRRLNGGIVARPDLPYFLTQRQWADEFDNAGIDVVGTWADAVGAADLVVDAGPSRTGAGRADLYRAAGVAVRYCGGERDPSLGPVIHSALNRRVGVGLVSARLASCNTTALGRVLGAIGTDRIRRAHATIVRCATDTDKADKGVTNGAVFDARPSHHADDLREIVSGLPLTSHAVTVPMVSGHVILLTVELTGGDGEAAVDRLGRAAGLTILEANRSHDSASIRAGALARGPGRTDRYEVALHLSRDGGTLDLALSLDNEAITVPETIDAIVSYGAAG